MRSTDNLKFIGNKIKIAETEEDLAGILSTYTCCADTGRKHPSHVWVKGSIEYRRKAILLAKIKRMPNVDLMRNIGQAKTSLKINSHSLRAVFGGTARYWEARLNSAEKEGLVVKSGLWETVTAYKFS